MVTDNIKKILRTAKANKARVNRPRWYVTSQRGK